MFGELRRLDLSYDGADSNASAQRLILALFPQWATEPGEIVFKHFTEGTTNTLIRATKMQPGASQDELDTSAVLIRAYGKGTEMIIDREREITSHHLLALHNLAPELLARFENGMIYRFVLGRPCEAIDLRVPRVYRGLAQRLGEWHAVISVNTQVQTAAKAAQIDAVTVKQANGCATINGQEIAPGKPKPNVWTILDQWIKALPSKTPEEEERNAQLRREYETIVQDFVDRPGLGENNLVVGHCDVLCGNVIIKNKPPTKSPIDPNAEVMEVGLIDYEYAMPCPAAFDLACHFSEWIGFECDYNGIPSKADRRTFLAEYLHSYRRHSRRTSFNHLKDDGFKVPLNRADSGEQVSGTDGVNGHVQSRRDREEEELDKLCSEVDLFRGLPGFWWGIWGLIQASISEIDFDYASYGKTRLDEYWNWKAEKSGSRVSEGREQSLREKRWNLEHD